MQSKTKPQTNNNNNNNKRRNKRRRPLRRRRRNQQGRQVARQARRQAIPMAVPAAYKKFFRLRNLGQTAVQVSGCDLIYKIPNSLETLNNTQVITIIPANPAYWTGTRIAAIAQGYQNYRPVSLRVHYCPQCPVTQQGNVIGGTLWDDVPSAESMQQSLKTSNGGFLTQCYQPISTTIRLKTNLQMNLYRMAGKIDQQSNPFYFIALTIATLNSQNQLINPGIFYVEYSYILKNPIGVSTQYSNSGITSASQVNTYYSNAIAITCADIVINTATFPPGTRLDVEYVESTPTYYYNNTPIDPPSIPIWLLMNQPLAQLGTRQLQPAPNQEIAYYLAVGVITDQEQITVPAHRVVLFNVSKNQPSNWTVYYNFSNETIHKPIETDAEYVYQVEMNENGLPGPLVIESSDPYSVTFSMSNTLIDYQPLPGKKKLVDYGILGPDAKDPEFDSSKVKPIDL